MAVAEQDDLSGRNDEVLLEFSTALTPVPKKVLKLTKCPDISPLVINAAPRGRGRPTKEKRAGRPWLKSTKDPLNSGPLGQFNRKRKAENNSEEPVKKRRGRPPKQKPVEVVKKRRGRPPKSRVLIDGEEDENTSGTTKKTARERAEIAIQSEDETFYDSFDICCLCQFSLNDPLKRGKKKMKCPQCHVVVHQPCYQKDRAEMGLVGCLLCNP